MNEAAHIRYQSKLFVGSSHSWALRTLANIPATSRVLDIGPGSGVIGRALKESGREDLTAVEIDAAAREHVRPIYQRVSGDIGDFGAEHFDVILLLDVIEHMAEPEKYLAEVNKMLSENGILLISVPNVAHWSVRFQLLFGFFCYTNRGLLDRTHLQFFTRSRVKNFEKTVPDIGRGVFDSSIPPAELVLPDWVTGSKAFESLSVLRLFLARMIPGLFAYQHLCIFRRRYN